MAASSYLQTSFTGGKWSPFAQGRVDQETYRTGLNECLNAYPVPVGAAVRRQGTVVGGTTRGGQPAVVRTFEFTQAQPFALEFTAGHMRMWENASLVTEYTHNVGAISTADPAVVQTYVPHGYSTGDQVIFAATALIGGYSPSGLKALFNRAFSITVIDTTHFSLQDAVTGANLDGSTINLAQWLVTVAKVVDIETPYAEADLQNIRVVQSEDVALVLCQDYAPQQITNVNETNGDGFAVLDFSAATFVNGPYLDPPTDGTTITASGVSGTINLTASAITSINGGSGFLSTDVGRHIALYYQPPQWAAGTTYSKGQNVTFNNAYYQSLVGSNQNNEPDTDNGTHWAVATAAAQWTWAIIDSIVSTSEVTATVQAADPQGILPGGALLSTTPAVSIWMLGVYSETSNYPTGGTFHEGRFWLYSEIYNRIDATMSNNNGTPPQNGLQFAPFALDGTVGDNNGISAIMENTQANPIFWAVSTETGIVLGTQGGEWVITASALDDPITPTSIQAKRKTRYGCANIEPVVAPLATIFVQRYQRHLYEYISDVYSRKWTGTNMAEKAQDIILPGIAEIAMVNEPVPIIWARTIDGRLIGLSYKRESPFGTQPANFAGWHHHTLGSGRSITSLRGGPAAGGNTDNLTMVTLDATTGIYFVEFMAPYFDETFGLLEADFVDSAPQIAAAEISGSDLILYGLTPYLSGYSLTAWIGGIDGGDYTVASDGTLTVPLPGGYDGSELLTATALSEMSAPTGTFAFAGIDIQVDPPGTGYFSPYGSTINYTSTHDPSGYAGQAWFDWASDRVYIATGDGTNNYFDVFNITTQALEASWEQTSLLNGIQGGSCMGRDGNIYYEFTGDTYDRFNTSTQTTDQTVSFTASGYGPAASVAHVQTESGHNYLVAVGLDAGTGGGGSAPWWAIDMDNEAVISGGTGSFVEGFSSITNGNALLTLRGPPGVTYAAVYGAPSPWTGASQIGLYAIGIEDVGPTAGAVRIGTITGADVVSGWTSVTLGVAPLYDETDGNIIMTVTGSDSTTRLIKVNATTAAVMWVIALPSFDFSRSRVRGGRMTYPDSTQFYFINTLTGSHTAQSVSGLSGGEFATDDKSGVYAQNVGSSGYVTWDTFGPASGGGSITPATIYEAPAFVGWTFTWAVQMLRPIAPSETQTQEGPALGKTRRTHMVAVMLVNSQGISFGTDLTQDISPLRPMNFIQPDQQEYPLTSLFSGTYWDSIEDDYSFDSMPAFTGSRPYPAAIAAVEAFLHTQERG